MEQKIKLFYGTEDRCTLEILNKLQAEKKILELFETKEIVSISINYEIKEPACACNADSKN